MFDLNYCKGTLWSCQGDCLQSGRIPIGTRQRSYCKFLKHFIQGLVITADTRIPIAASSSCLYTVISGHLPAQQITHTGQLLHTAKKEKQFNRLSALVDNPHFKSKENLYKKVPEITNLEANLISKLFCNASCHL